MGGDDSGDKKAPAPAVAVGEPSAAASPERLREVVLDLELAKERERGLREEATALLKGLQAITDATDPSEIFERLLEALRVPFGFDAAMVLRPVELEFESERVLVVDAATEPTFINARLPLTKTFERVLQRGRVSTHLDAAVMPEWQDERSQALFRDHVGSALYVPLEGAHERALVVFTCRAARAFQPRHEQLARRFLPLATQALRDAERRSQVVRANHNMRLVLDNVGEGLLTVSRNRIVVGERSAIVDRWFGAIAPETHFEDVLSRRDPEAGSRFAQAWKELLLAEEAPHGAKTKTEAVQQAIAVLPNQLRSETEADAESNSRQVFRIDYQPVPTLADWQHMLVVISDITAEVERARLEARAKEVLRMSELSIAHRVQTSLLPHELDRVVGLEIAARMLPAEEVGGDYYDVIPTAATAHNGGGCWLAIGDVTGHGLTAGLVMLMVQSAVGALVRGNPAASPSAILTAVNELLFDNIRMRLNDDDHVTLSLLKYQAASGQFEIAGAHEDVVIYRARAGRCEVLPTHGTWVGGIPDISRVTKTSTHRLEPGDVLWLYTDGLTEAMATAPDGSRKQFGLGRVCEIIERFHEESVTSICDRLFEELRSWSPTLNDDVTIVGARYSGGR